MYHNWNTFYPLFPDTRYIDAETKDTFNALPNTGAQQRITDPNLVTRNIKPSLKQQHSSRTGCGNVGCEIRRNNRWIVAKGKGLKRRGSEHLVIFDVTKVISVQAREETKVEKTVQHWEESMQFLPAFHGFLSPSPSLKVCLSSAYTPTRLRQNRQLGEKERERETRGGPFGSIGRGFIDSRNRVPKKRNVARATLMHVQLLSPLLRRLIG